MDELLKNCNDRLFKVGDKVRIRLDIDDLAALLEKDVNRYRRIFPNRTTQVEKPNYNISLEMKSYAGKTAKVVEVFPQKNEMPLLGALYTIKINGCSRSSKWFWKHALLEKVEEENRDSGGSTRFPLNVGDTVTVRRDIAKRCDKNGFICTTVNGHTVKSTLIIPSMFLMAGETGRITRVHNYGKDDFAYELAFTNPEFEAFNQFIWSLGCLEEFHDYKAYVEGNSGKKKAQRKKSEERGEDYYGDSREIIDDSAGLKTDFFAYDYKGRKRMFQDIDGFITKIDVTIISGDETGLVYFVKDGKANRIAFDASVGTRFISYDDGTYTVEGKDNIKKWLSWSYDKDKAKNVNYAIQHMIDFLGGDK